MPGTYSLVSRTGEEQIALAALVGLAGERRPDAVVLCVDATQLVRGLYLVLQAQELGLPVVVALTMMDEAGAAAPDAGGAGAAAGLPGGAGGGAQGQGPGARCGRRWPGGSPTARPAPHWQWRPGRRLEQAIGQVREAFGRRCPRTGRRATPWRCGR